MEQLIKTRKNSTRNCSASPESTVDLVVSYVSEAESSNTVVLGHLRNSSKKSKTGCSTPPNQWVALNPHRSTSSSRPYK